ncbi:MAG: hypothetical protein ING90_11230 [Rhodocyclaceae bacterium]|nr:hypothetical protein [Rhodocyclaceae bacterium]MCE2981457.1 hypothetical protein [Betaproteobacteria bacterium]MCA3075005.1 hypothetical protein [Rhodocyclaceae bacterium]MCA3088364.1 hypothetical protein [Rhodocyclaceae bacterium]MCA3096102.1 hypothetical protein [Rhodocyclaceae bacterium]
MKIFLSVLSTLLSIAGSGIQAAAPAATPASAVNPLTGQSLAFETTQRRLEQMRLETQLLEEEAKQAAIRNNLSLAPIRRSSEERRLQAEMFGPAAAGGLTVPAARGPGAAPVAPLAARPGRVQAPSVQPLAPASSAMPPAPATFLSPPGPQVLAILRNGDRRRAIVQAGAATATVSEGEEWMGRRIGAITDGSVTLDGTVIELPRNPAVIAAIDRRPPPGQPQSAQAVAPVVSARLPAVTAPGMAQPQAFPPLPPLPALPVIGPIDPRNPLSAIGPQPAPATPTANRPLTPTLPTAMPASVAADTLP